MKKAPCGAFFISAFVIYNSRMQQIRDALAAAL